MPLAKHLTRREGTYSFRVRVPKNLTTALGKKEIAYSLRTKDPHTAKELSYIHSYNISRSFRELELKLAENPSLMLSQSLSYENMGKRANIHFSHLSKCLKTRKTPCPIPMIKGGELQFSAFDMTYKKTIHPQEPAYSASALLLH